MRQTAFLVVSLMLTVAAAAQQNRPTTAAPGRLVDVGANALHISCVGVATGAPTVVLEAGAGDYSNRWTAVQALLAPRVRSCAYDRAGLGWSGGTERETFAESNADLRALLTAAGVTPPYVLVGHSIGALLVRRYFSVHPETVVGMVLVGATYENGQLFNLGANRWLRIREQASPLGSDFRELSLARQANPTPLGDLPLIVPFGTRPSQNGAPDDVLRESAVFQEEYPQLSRNSRLVRDPASGHHIHVDNPPLVASAIEEVVTAAMKGTKLAGKP